jgi:parvulin-like peptidyl-prolyl isomerase
MSLISIQRNIRRLQPLLVVFFIIFVAGIFFSFRIGSGPTAVRDDRSLFANIDGHDVTTAEYAQKVEALDNQMRMMMPNASIPLQQQAELPRYAYDQLLDDYATARAAQANGISVSEGDAQAELRKQVDQILAQRGEGLTAAEKEQAAQGMMQRVGVDTIQRQLLAQRLQEKLTGEARPVEVKVAHVLIKVDKRREDEAARLAQDVARKARTGETFSQLVKQYSEDAASKAQDGVVGWASAQPPTDPKAKAMPEAAQTFVPEFTAAALRLHPNEISNPIRTTYGYHVLKALQERPFQPTDPAVTKDPKKRQEAIDSYRNTVANQIMRGLVEEQRARIEATVKPYASWLKGYLKEKNGRLNLMATASTGAKPNKNAALADATADYAEALRSGGPEIPAMGSGLPYKVASLYQQTGQDDKALEILNKWASRTGDPEMYFMQGESLQKLKQNTEALKAYQTSLDRATKTEGSSVLGRLAAKFKELGHPELADKATAEEQKQRARQQAEQKRQMEEMKQRTAAAKKASATLSTKAAGAGKPAAANAPAAKAPAAANAPAANKPASTPPAATGNAPAAGNAPAKPAATTPGKP